MRIGIFKRIGRQGGNLSGLCRLALKSVEQTADFGEMCEIVAEVKENRSPFVVAVRG